MTHSTKLNGTTVLANESGNAKAYLTEAQATAAAEKVNGKAFQIQPNGGAFYVQIAEFVYSKHLGRNVCIPVD